MAAEDKARGRGALWLRGALFVSLALNLLVAGIVLGRVLEGPGFPGRPDRRAGDDPVIPYTRAFDEGQRRALRGELRSAFEARRPTRGGVTEQYRAALDLLRAEPFDPGAFATLLETQAARAETRRKAGQAVLATYLASMKPEARHRYADRLEEEIARLERRRGHD